MNLRQWARATHRAFKELPPEERSHLTAAQVEEVMRMSFHVLIEKLSTGEELRINDFGRFWVEEKPPSVIVSNLGSQPQAYQTDRRKVVRFRASSCILSELNPGRHDS